MSFKAAAWAIETSVVNNANEKLVLIILADCHNAESGRCDPSIDYLADKTKLSRRSVERAISGLEKAGLLSRKQRSNGAGLKTSNAYTLHTSESRIDASERRSVMRQRVAKDASESRKGCVREAECDASESRINQEYITRNKNQEEEPIAPVGATVPHEQIIDIYHLSLPELPKVQVWNDQRKKLLKSRWQESADRQNLDWWKFYFSRVAASDFLMGRTENPFTCSLEWLLRPSNLP
jgi:DNA-binding transcriptional regulator YhcF (GntR family)